MKVLITGGAGFIGSNIARELVNKSGTEILILDDLSSGKLSNLNDIKNKINFIHGSITDKEKLEESCRGVDIIFHLAAKVSVEESVKKPILTNEINLQGTLNLLEAAKNNKVSRLIFSSSASVYGQTKVPVIDETEPIAPVSPYALQKYTAERYCLLYNEYTELKTIALRYFNVYGPFQQENGGYAGVVYRFITDGLNKGKVIIEGDGHQTRDFVFVQDIVKANIAAMNAGKECLGHVYNVGTGNQISVLDLYKGVSAALGNNIKYEYIKARPGDVRNSCSNIEKIKNMLGYSPEYNINDGLKITIKWIRSIK